MIPSRETHHQRRKHAGRSEAHRPCRQLGHADLSTHQPEHHGLEELPNHAERQRHLVLRESMSGCELDFLMCVNKVL